MTVNRFWDFVLSAEQEYADYRKQIMKRFALSAAETDIVMFLANNPAFDTAAQIAKIRKIQKSQVSLSVNSLLEKGLLEGRRQPSDKKSIHLTLTQKAEPVIAYGRAVQREFTRALFAGFSEEEKAEFTRLHAKIAENIENKRKQPLCSKS